MRWLLLFTLLPFCSLGQNAYPAIGLWREHLPYHNAQDVTAADKKIFCATPYSLFSVDLQTNEVERISKVSGLSETGISAIQYDSVSKKLFVAYTNSNIDVLTGKGIINIPDIKRSNISGDKNIYHIYPDNDRCYLSSGVGIIVLDAVKYEVKETWFIGNGGGYIKTNAFLKSGNFFYAATDEGLKRISATAANPMDFRQWQNVSGTNGLPAASARSVVSFMNSVVVLQNDSLYMQTGNNWSLLFANDIPVNTINSSEGKLFISQRHTNGTAQVIVLNASGILERIIKQPGFISYPLKAISKNGEYWIADLYGGLTRWYGNNFESYRLNSPQNIATGEIAIKNDILFAAAGSVNSAWNYQYNPNGVYKFENNIWTNYNLYNHKPLDTLLDVITVAIDPRDASSWAGSFGGGLLHIGSNNLLKIYKQNSPLMPHPGDPGSYRVGGLAFDEDNNLWVSNFGSPRQLHVLKSNGTWQSFSAPFFLNENAVSQIVIDDFGQKWIASPLGNGLIVFDENDLANSADDRWKLYKTGQGSGNLSSNEVLALAKDKDGFMWVGTTDGVAVFQCADLALTQPCDAIWPIIKEDAFANYLFKGQEVRSIAVDGANRKWMATATGVWLISADGDKVLAHYNEENSPLLSDDVKKITINGSTGEVFIATMKGLISFRGTATEASEKKSGIIIFPNPVPPDFSGNIGIRGLPENSIVKITELNGRLVHQTRSLGGQAVWNGRNYKGNKVATGVYLVIAADDKREEKAVGKIVFVSNGK